MNRSHLSAFISNCKKYNHRLLKGDVKPNITIFMDWTDDELEQLGLLSVHFSGIASSFDEIDVREKEYSFPRKTTNFCSSSLFEYSRPDSICSTSWATSIITMKLWGVEKLDEFLEFHNSGAKFLILFYKISLGCMFCPKMSYVTNIHMI